MNPAQRNKIDISKLSDEEQKLFRLYGKLPSHKNIITKMQKDRKFFDSGDYALSKAGKAPQNTVGTAIPSPENIPHAATPSAGQQISASPTNGVTSPVKESSLHHSDAEDDAVPDPFEHVSPVGTVEPVVAEPQPIEAEPTPVEPAAE